MNHAEDDEVHVLLVEDDSTDVLLLRRAFVNVKYKALIDAMYAEA